MTASTPPSARTPHDPPAWYDDADAPTTRQHAVENPVASEAPTRASAARRTVSARVAAVIGVVAFLLGAGLSMLTGPLLGPGGGPGGPGGPGGAPGTSQQQSTTGSSGTTQSGTTSSGTGSTTNGT